MNQLLQVRILGQRFLLSWWRSPINLLVQLAQYIFFAVMIGVSLSCDRPAHWLHIIRACSWLEVPEVM